MKLIIALLLFLCCATSALATGVEGRVVLGDEPLPGMRVLAYTDLNPAGKSIVRAVVTDQEGHFELSLPNGFVALYARSDDGRYFAFCGRNPLYVQAGQTLWAGLQAIAVSTAKVTSYDDEYSTALEGIVTLAGRPLADAYVSLYLDAAEDLKGQGYRLSAPTGEDGFFAFDGLPESNYFLVARKRENGGRVGPLAVGDMLGVFAGNPLDLKAGEMTAIEIPLVVRQPRTNGSGGPDRPGSIMLSGRILDESGQPLAGLHLFAYRDQVIGHQRPAALSPPTGIDGRFELSFREPGIYYIGARQAYGDSPAPGELFGLYEGNADHGLQIKTGKNAAIEIRVAPISLD